MSVDDSIHASAVSTIQDCKRAWEVSSNTALSIEYIGRTANDLQASIQELQTLALDQREARLDVLAAATNPLLDGLELDDVGPDANRLLDVGAAVSDACLANAEGLENAGRMFAAASADLSGIIRAIMKVQGERERIRKAAKHVLTLVRGVRDGPKTEFVTYAKDMTTETLELIRLILLRSLCLGTALRNEFLAQCVEVRRSAKDLISAGKASISSGGPMPSEAASEAAREFASSLARILKHLKKRRGSRTPRPDAGGARRGSSDGLSGGSGGSGGGGGGGRVRNNPTANGSGLSSHHLNRLGTKETAKSDSMSSLDNMLATIGAKIEGIAATDFFSEFDGPGPATTGSPSGHPAIHVSATPPPKPKKNTKPKVGARRGGAGGGGGGEAARSSPTPDPGQTRSTAATPPAATSTATSARQPAATNPNEFQTGDTSLLKIGAPRTAHAIHNFFAENPYELSFPIGAVITDTYVTDDSNWLVGTYEGNTGIFPSTWIEWDDDRNNSGGGASGGGGGSRGSRDSDYTIPDVEVGTVPNSFTCRAMFTYEATKVDELPFLEGELITEVIETDTPEWWLGFCNGEKGLFPATYVERLTDEEVEAMNATDYVAPPVTYTVVTVHAFAGRDDELTFIPGTTITNCFIADDDGQWMMGEIGSERGLFPSNHADIVETHGATGRAVFDFKAAGPDELTLSAGVLITNIIPTGSEEWVYGSCLGKSGMFPAHYVDYLQ